MRLRGLAGFALGGLWRQKVRTALTLVGVTVGTCALAFSLALGLGLRAFIDHQFQSRDDFWRIVVHTDEPPLADQDVPAEKLAITGDVSEARRERLREALKERYLATRPPKPPVPLSPENLAAIAALPDVKEVRTYRSADCRVTAAGAVKPALSLAVAGPLEGVKPRLLSGRLPEAPDEILVSELVLHDLGRGSDADLESALRLPVKLEVGGVRNGQPMALARALTGRLPGDGLTVAQTELLEKLTAQLPRKLGAFDLTAVEREELRRLLEESPDPEERPWESGLTAGGTYRVCGVVRIVTREERKKNGPLESWELAGGGVLLAPAAGEALFARLPWARAGRLYSADVRVRPGGDLPGTVAAVEAMGFRTFSAVKWFASARREVTLIAGGLNLFALIALLVAGVGITNTLVTSVVERTKEIGILRAVGATRGQIQGLFLAEGAVIGLAGSALGLALARGLAVPADRWVWGMIQKVAEGDTLRGTTVFVFPWWLWVGSVVFAVLVTTAAAYYPARRAAKIHPIEALRYG